MSLASQNSCKFKSPIPRSADLTRSSCTPREECLCDAWGLCDKNDPEVQRAIDGTRWLDVDGNPRGYLEWKTQREKHGLESNLAIFWVENMWDDPEQLGAIKAIPELYNATSFP